MRVLDRREQPGLLAILPLPELPRVGDLEAVEKIRDLQRRGDLGPQHVAPQQSVEVETQRVPA